MSITSVNAKKTGENLEAYHATQVAPEGERLTKVIQQDDLCVKVPVILQENHTLLLLVLPALTDSFCYCHDLPVRVRRARLALWRPHSDES